MENEIYPKEFMEFVINRLGSMPLFLEKADGIKRNPDRKCFCPFHHNEDTPAAKMYHNEDGWYLFCFSEQKQYRPSDVFERKLVNTRIDQAFYRLWEQLSEDRKRMLLEESGQEVDRIPSKWKEGKELLDEFKRGTNSIEEHLNNIISLIE